ncbi:MAG: A/G-specific adenine glycosylase [Planctomycetes bacterium]|nr:A/G-specific adenine glycosylase [Planctomycetota bacterium]
MQVRLLGWFQTAARDLPWRRERSAWRTWVSELMLQQTTVGTVAPRFEEFLRRFPDARAMAAASEQDVVEAWAGLGYYSRARNLHRAARIVAEKHGGEVPRTWDDVRALPGIGDYTAGAVLSLAHGVRVPCVDGNVRRVLSRLAGRDLDGRELAERAAELVPESAPGKWNEALMELGATVCRPRDPACGACPLAAGCRARIEGSADRLPAPKVRPATVKAKASYAWIERRGRVLLGRRPPGPLGGLWEFPGDRVPRACLAAALRARLGVAARVGARIASARHTITHHRIDAALYAATLRADPRAAGYAELSWIRERDLPALPMTAAARKLSGDRNGSARVWKVIE